MHGGFCPHGRLCTICLHHYIRCVGQTAAAADWRTAVQHSSPFRLSGAYVVASSMQTFEC